jgi:hypothetical protein
MSRFAEIEIAAGPQQQGRYPLTLRLNLPNSQVDARHADASMAVDREVFRAAEHADDAYGRLIADTLFGDASARMVFGNARSVASALNLPLRIRLVLDATELHELKWERMLDPDDAASTLATSEAVVLSRYVSSRDLRPVFLRSRSELRALVAVADPAGVAGDVVGGRPLPPMDPAAELERAADALGDIEATPLAAPVTLDRLIAEARTGYDILYLVCHGAILDGTARIWLMKEDGSADVIPGDTLVRYLAQLEHRPRLVILASCMSAGGTGELATSDDGVLAALGPRLAEEGVPAVIAMQGNITQESAARFARTFFSELQRDGAIDRATAVARRALVGRPDWWMPVLFTRLREGRIAWYTPGFAGPDATDQARGWGRFPALLSSIREGKCTPILGSGVAEALAGSRREIARTLARKHGFPLAPHDAENLEEVLQFLGGDQDRGFMENAWRKALLEYVRVAHRRLIPDQEATAASYETLLSRVGQRRRQDDAHQPHRVLAGLPLPLYIDATPTDLLADALRDAGKYPEVEVCRWHDGLRLSPSVFEREPSYEPDARRPLVFHVFGRLAVPDSLVLTEDDFFDFLMGVATTRNLTDRDGPAIPGRVRRALTDSALLFLGFQLDGFTFRALFRALMENEGNHRRRRYAHVAAQIDPEEGRAIAPERAMEFLEKSFRGADITIFRGAVDDFTRQLAARLAEAPAGGGDT